MFFSCGGFIAGAWLCVNAAGTHELIVVNVKEMQKRLAQVLGGVVVAFDEDERPQDVL